MEAWWNGGGWGGEKKNDREIYLYKNLCGNKPCIKMPTGNAGIFCKCRDILMIESLPS